ncbi:MAG TPA: SpoIIE family protein phosphatase [Thermoanaerobaculia bacterium]|nr:SpoIIE family protein phosphatase [Thermoanaerobaculia bacterium]
MSSRSHRRLWVVLGALAAGSLLAVLLQIPVLRGLGTFLLVAMASVLLVWLIARGLRRLLWRAGRRLAFSYLLIGVVPIPIALGILLVGGYLLCGFFLSHLFRSELGTLSRELATTTALAADAWASGAAFDAPLGEVTFAYYRDGRLAGGAEGAPGSWPAWLEDETDVALDTQAPARLPLVEIGEGQVSLAAAVERGGYGVLALFDGDLPRELSHRSQVWVRLANRDERASGGVTVSLGDNEWVFQPFRQDASDQQVREFYTTLGLPAERMVIGIEAAGALYDLGSGEVLQRSVSATLLAPVGVVLRNLLSSSSEIDAIAWLAFVVPAFLLFDLYVVAAFMAILLILGISRAVNRLSEATGRVQQGDFTVRIPVKRRDQIGQLQSSFNEMTANLESLVEQAAARERLEQELRIAQELQKSLLPTDFAARRGIQVATYFEPSAAIGGDYFDLFPLDDRGVRLGVVVADVAGHGLSAGLRMAMIKSAIDTLVQEGHDPDRIFASVDRLLRGREGERRSFVTATLALLDLAVGTADITNAGHPPTYLVREGEVEEILLPGTPLGTLGARFGRRRIELRPGDVLVWLSDGFIEACDGTDDSFGYDRTLEALAGAQGTADAVRDRLLEAVRQHTGDRAADDDRTLVALRYLGHVDPRDEREGAEIGSEGAAPVAPATGVSS